MRLVLCDDNRILCEALAVAMERWGHQVVAITSSCADGVTAVDTHRPDVMLLDLGFPARTTDTSVQSGRFSTARAIRQHYPGTAVLLLSGVADRAIWSAAMHLGAAGILCKDHGLGKIADALDVIAAGGAVFEPTAVSHASDRPATRQRPLRLYPLTPREREVLRRITAGQSTGQMADEMNIAINTLRSYVKNVLTKLGAHNRLQAAALATREDLLSELPA